jgi:hypothetical protein
MRNRRNAQSVHHQIQCTWVEPAPSFASVRSRTELRLLLVLCLPKLTCWRRSSPGAGPDSGERDAALPLRLPPA